MVTGVKSIDLSRQFLLTFGQPVRVRVPKRSWRFDVKSELGIYVGVPNGSVGGGLTYYPSTRAIASRADLVPLDITPKEFEKYENNRTDDNRPSPVDVTFEIPQVLQEFEEERDKEGNLLIPVEFHTNPPEEIKNDPNIIELLGKPTNRRQVKKILRKLGVNTRAMSKLSALMVRFKHGNKFSKKKKRKTR